MNALSLKCVSFSFRYRLSWSAGYGRGRPRLIWAPVKSIGSLLLRSWCMTPLIHRLLSATATSRLCEHTWMMQVERLAEDFRSFTSSSGVWKTFKEEEMGHCTALSRSCCKYLRVYGRCHLSSVSMCRFAGCRTTSRLWHSQCKCVEVWLKYRFDWGPCSSKCFINILVVY